MRNKNYTFLLLSISAVIAVSVPCAYAKPTAKHSVKLTSTADHGKKSKSSDKKTKSPQKSAANGNSNHRNTTRRQLAASEQNQNFKANSKSSARQHTVITRSQSVYTVNHAHSHQEKTPRIATRSINQTIAEADNIISSPIESPVKPGLSTQPLSLANLNSAHVDIETSLFLDGLEAGLSKEVITQLTNIFAWDIDFAHSLQPGDHFTVIYAKTAADDDTDEVIAAEFVTQNNIYRAVRFLDGSGKANYYTPDGQSMQKAFLSTPVDFAQISSHFSMHRKHPVLNRIRAHKGVDYAARTGTPVKSTGDGVVLFCGRQGGYGQVVVVQHGDRYETVYAHLSGFKRGLSEGIKVKQGEIIGYVGQTGLATGPHLHYEFHVDGEHRNPETVKIPHTLPIDGSLMADFRVQTMPLLTQLAQIKSKSLYAKGPSNLN